MKILLCKSYDELPIKTYKNLPFEQEAEAIQTAFAGQAEVVMLPAFRCSDHTQQ